VLGIDVAASVAGEKSSAGRDGLEKCVSEPAPHVVALGARKSSVGLIDQRSA
jgi:hypothetical protein